MCIGINVNIYLSTIRLGPICLTLRCYSWFFFGKSWLWKKNQQMTKQLEKKSQGAKSNFEMCFERNFWKTSFIDFLWIDHSCKISHPKCLHTWSTHACTHIVKIIIHLISSDQWLTLLKVFLKICKKMNLCLLFTSNNLNYAKKKTIWLAILSPFILFTITWFIYLLIYLFILADQVCPYSLRAGLYYLFLCWNKTSYSSGKWYTTVLAEYLLDSASTVKLWLLLCDVVLGVHSSFVIIWLRKRELVPSL